MLGSDLFPAGLFLFGILLSMAADARLRRADGLSWRQGCLTAACAGLAFCACAAVIR